MTLPSHKKTTGLVALIDGGGTRTRLRLIDRATRQIAEGFSGPSNLTLGVNQAWLNIDTALTSAQRLLHIEQEKDKKIDIFAGLAGARNDDMRRKFREAAPEKIGDIEVYNDGYACLLGAFQGEPGIILVIGTGVAAFALHNNDAVIDASGHGFPVGDEGGGAWLGCRALGAYLKAVDGRISTGSQVFEQLEQKFGRDIMGIHAWLRKARSTQFATIAPIVANAFQQGDTFANELVSQGVVELCSAIKSVEDPTVLLPIAISGGLADFYFEPLKKHFGERLQKPAGKELDGLALRAFGPQPLVQEKAS